MTSLEIDSTPLYTVFFFLQGIEKMSPTLDDMISYQAFSPKPCPPPTFTQPKLKGVRGTSLSASSSGLI